MIKVLWNKGTFPYKKEFQDASTSESPVLNLSSCVYALFSVGQKSSAYSRSGIVDKGINQACFIGLVRTSNIWTLCSQLHWLVMILWLRKLLQRTPVFRFVHTQKTRGWMWGKELWTHQTKFISCAIWLMWIEAQKRCILLVIPKCLV